MDPVCGPPGGDMPSDDGQILTRHLSDQSLEAFELPCPSLHLRNQINRHIDGARLAGLFKRQLPGRRFAAGSTHLGKRSLHEQPHLSQFPAVGFSKAMVTTGRGQSGIHEAKYINLAIMGNKKERTKKYSILNPAKDARSHDCRPREMHEQHEEFLIWSR